MTLTLEVDLHKVKMNHYVKYVKGHFVRKLSSEHTDTRTMLYVDH